MRLPLLRRLFSFLALALVAALFLVVFTPGCGRSSLEVEGFDASFDAPPSGNCGPSNCPGGCCDATGVCRTGSDTRACGASGERCSDCIANGFQFCDGNRKTCGRDVQDCSSQCPNGCCQTDPSGSKCLAGTEPGACGGFGGSCVDCTEQGRDCDPDKRVCGTGSCDFTNCAGCCVGDKCLDGSNSQACGSNGELCRSCSAMGQSCLANPKGGGSCEGVPVCGPQNCGGCCNGNVCVGGSDQTACGKQGQACSNCAALGRTCIPQGQPNERTCQLQATCNAGNCPGCCVGNNCVVATTPAACGKGGQVCKGCAMNETCTNGVCTPAPNCSPANCAGCCIGADICATGNQNTACGVGGIQCNNCAGTGKVCQGGTCQSPVCGPGNCAGCCSGNTCVIGTQDNACGGNGAACNDCTPGGQLCRGRVCRDKCSPANCAGCCTAANACALGFTNSACGSSGSNCVNCTAGGSTCDLLVIPRVCVNQQNECPAPYPSCPAGTTTPITPSLQGLCDDLVDLASLQAACAGGPDTGTCIAAFQVLAAQNAACASCVAPFNEPFQQFRGIYLCVAPFVGAACNRSTGCAADCQDTSCVQCSPGSEDQCRNQVNNNGGQCNTFVQQTACVVPEVGPGDLCSPFTYGNPPNFGRWLRAVGNHFCGSGP